MFNVNVDTHYAINVVEKLINPALVNRKWSGRKRTKMTAKMQLGLLQTQSLAQNVQNQLRRTPAATI